MMTGEHLAPVQLQQIVDKTIRDGDKDCDGQLSFNEFCELVQEKNESFVNKWIVADL